MESLLLWGVCALIMAPHLLKVEYSLIITQSVTNSAIKNPALYVYLALFNESMFSFFNSSFWVLHLCYSCELSGYIVFVFSSLQ